MSNSSTVADVLNAEFEWVRQIIRYRGKNNDAPLIGTPLATPPSIAHAVAESSYAEFIANNDLSWEERLLIMLALAPTIQPLLLDYELRAWLPTMQISNEPRSIWGFAKSNANFYQGILPTAMLFVYLVAGTDTAQRASVIDKLLQMQYSVLKSEVVLLSATSHKYEPALQGVLYINASYVSTLLI